MTDADWESSSDPDRMLDYLLGRNRPGLLTWFGFRRPEVGPRHARVSDRTLRLFVVAYSRCIGFLVRDERLRQAVETNERYAEGPATAGALESARAAAWEAMDALEPSVAWEVTRAHVGGASSGNLWYFAAQAIVLAAARPTEEMLQAVPAIERAAIQAATEWRRALEIARDAGTAVRARLLRCIFGNPFRPLPNIDESWLSWSDSTVRRMAESIYRDRNFSDLPVLADALAEAGCTAEELLEHLRSPGVHTRGCWALDLLLGKE